MALSLSFASGGNLEYADEPVSEAGFDSDEPYSEESFDGGVLLRSRSQSIDSLSNESACGYQSDVDEPYSEYSCDGGVRLLPAGQPIDPASANSVSSELTYKDKPLSQERDKNDGRTRSGSCHTALMGPTVYIVKHDVTPLGRVFPSEEPPKPVRRVKSDTCLASLIVSWRSLPKVTLDDLGVSDKHFHVPANKEATCSQTITQFYRFPQFPLEIRQIIWKLHMRPRQVPFVFCTDGEYPTEYTPKEIHAFQHWRNHSSLPATLAINQESRTEALLYYTVLHRFQRDILADKVPFIINPNKSMVVNTKIDTVYLSYCCMRSKQWHILNNTIKAFRLQSLTENLVDSLERLEIRNIWPTDIQNGCVTRPFVNCKVIEVVPGYLMFDRNVPLSRIFVFKGLKELHLKFEYGVRGLSDPCLESEDGERKIIAEFERDFNKFLTRHKQFFTSGKIPVVTTQLGPLKENLRQK